MRLILVRHGQSTWHDKRRFQGWQDPPLSERGRWQAERVAAALSGGRLDAVFSSDLQRAAETARCILTGRSLTVHSTPALREIHLGRWEGRTAEEVERAWPDEYANWRKDPLRFRPDGGESVSVFLSRLAVFAQSLPRDSSTEEVLVVGHSGSLRALTAVLLGIGPSLYAGLSVDHGTISELRLRGRHWRIHRWNDASHLDQRPPLRLT